MNVKYRVTLDASERVQLVAMVLGGKGAFRRLKRAQILLAADSGSTDEEIARNVAVGTSTVYRRCLAGLLHEGSKETDRLQALASSRSRRRIVEYIVV